MRSSRALLTVNVLVFVGVFVGARYLKMDRARPQEVRSTESDLQRVAVLVVSSECTASETRAMVDAFRDLSTLLEAEAQLAGEAFHSVGVAIDADPEVGIGVLRAFGEFDELAVGGGWSNTSALHYVVRDIAGEAFVPQVVVLRRHRRSGAVLDVSTDSLIIRLRGENAVHQWLSRRQMWPEQPPSSKNRS